ncbi:MAG TPA: hypothetical protein VJ787_10405, partial [Thermoleophilia bacterium]|nr:hypothetical protein [Thermoleophilia bacterium]
LLDHALGLEEDPELERELTRSEELRERLQMLQADLHQIDAELHGVLPPAEAGWGDLANERWRRLQPFLELPAPRRSRSLRSRLLAPAVALLIVAALLVGVFSLRDTAVQQSRTAAGDQALAPESAAAPSAVQKAVGELAAGYQQVVVAQAGAVEAGRQTYEVVRVLKGPTLTTFTVDLADADGAPVGSLQVVYLDPLDGTGDNSGQGTLEGEGPGAISSPPGPREDYGANGEPAVAGSGPREVTYLGKPALVQPLPSGVDPSTLTVPR